MIAQSNMTTYQLGSPDWLIPTIVILLFLLATTAWTYARGWFGSWAAIAVALKITGIIILAVCLLEPTGRGQRPKPQANVLPILVDTSASMTMQAASGTDSIAEQVTRALSEDAEWYQRVQQVFDVRPLQFAERLDPVDSFAELTFEATQSNLRQSLETIASRFQSRPVAGILLFTDGNLTDQVDNFDWASLGVPVFPVYADQQEKLPDLRVDNIAVSETDFETAPITIDAEIFQQDLNGKDITVSLKKVTGEILEQRQISAGNEPSQPVRFRFRPEKSGVSFYTLECSLVGEEELLGVGVSRKEVTLANNSQLISVNQRTGPYQVLYLAGRPNWEFKYLRRALDEDAEVRLLGLLRLAKKQPKFSFRDSSLQSSANPLFAGLGGDEEEIAEQLDEPVLIPIGVQDATELAEGFLDAPETLFQYAAIIIDDLEASFFTQDQLLLLRQFVSKRGGSLLLLGGDDSLEKGNFGDSALADLAPVYLARSRALNANNNLADGTDRSNDDFKMQLTREGMLEPFLRLRGTEEGETQRVAKAPPLKVLNRAERIKPGAVILATATDSGGVAHPALVSQSFGRGKTVAMMFGDLWRWSLQDGLPGRSSTSDNSDLKDTAPSDDPAQVWRQLVRWLVSDVQQRVSLTAEATNLPSVTRLKVDVKGADFSPTDVASVLLSVQTPDGGEIILTTEPDAENPGRYFAEIWAREPGGYIATATANAPDGSQIGSDSFGWASNPADDEFKTLGVNKNLLTEIAEKTGGQLVPFTQLQEFASSMSSRPVPEMENWTFPLWHRWWILLLAVLCLSGEWGIRRWRGMP